MTETLHLIEIFRSIQGESSLAGLPTTFIRTARCNLRCSWCDTTYSFGRGEACLLDSILDQVAHHGCRRVCITGGEPLLQPAIYPLMRRLCNESYLVSLETGGSLCTSQVDSRVRIILDVKCPGSGMSNKNYFANLNRLRKQDEVKFVLVDRKDYDFANTICARYRLWEQVDTVLFSPAFGQLAPSELVCWMLQDGIAARLNLQLHKFIWNPNTRGV